MSTLPGFALYAEAAARRRKAMMSTNTARVPSLTCRNSPKLPQTKSQQAKSKLVDKLRKEWVLFKSHAQSLKHSQPAGKTFRQHHQSVLR
jgi:hypothetical protein